MPKRERPLPGATSGPARQAAGNDPVRIIIHNDDVTPVEFVVHVLVGVFLLPVINAEQVTYSAHLNGRAYVQTLPAAEGHRRIGSACFAARLRQFPLQFSMEAE